MTMKKSIKKSKQQVLSSKKTKNKGLGNPAVAGLIAEVLPTVLKAGVFIGGAFLVYKLIKNGTETIKQNKVASQFGDGTKTGLAAQYAVEIQASNLGSYIYDTKEDVIFRVADKMFRNGVSFQLVSQAYERQYNLNLLEELSGDLNASEMMKFNQILQGAGLAGPLYLTA